MKVFIDFDDVIFNAKEFRSYLKDFFESNGISEELFQKYYYSSSDLGEIKLFDPEGLFLSLEKYEKMKVDELRINFADYIKNLSKFIFEDAYDFFEKIGRSNLYLISFGLPVFQNEKIVACGVDKLVSGCVVTKSSKSEAIKKVMESLKIDLAEKIVFIDDRVEQVQDIKKNFPQAKTFLLCRKEGRYCDKKNEYCDYEVHNLEEISEILSNSI